MGSQALTHTQPGSTPVVTLSHQEVYFFFCCILFYLHLQPLIHTSTCCRLPNSNHRVQSLKLCRLLLTPGLESLTPGPMRHNIIHTEYHNYFSLNLGKHTIHVGLLRMQYWIFIFIVLGKLKVWSHCSCILTLQHQPAGAECSCPFSGEWALLCPAPTEAWPSVISCVHSCFPVGGRHFPPCMSPAG